MRGETYRGPPMTLGATAAAQVRCDRLVQGMPASYRVGPDGDGPSLPARTLLPGLITGGGDGARRGQ